MFRCLGFPDRSNDHKKSEENWMSKYDKIKKMKDKYFKLIADITQIVFTKMLDVLRKKYEEEHA
jgi:alkyl hydroperoxide reductase subunit AhpC